MHLFDCVYDNNFFSSPYKYDWKRWELPNCVGECSYYYIICQIVKAEKLQMLKLLKNQTVQNNRSYVILAVWDACYDIFELTVLLVVKFRCDRKMHIN